MKPFNSKNALLISLQLMLLLVSATAFSQTKKNEPAPLSKSEQTVKSGIRANAQNFRDTGIDETFKPQLNPRDLISAADLQKDGKIVVGGRFLRLNPRNNQLEDFYDVLRYYSDGSIDSTFKLEKPDDWNSTNQVSVIKIQPDGKILIANDWRICRFNQDGSIDQSFNSPVISWNYSSVRVHDMHLYEDGKILISGSFYSVNNVIRYNIAKLNADGTLDETFQGYGGSNVINKKSAVAPDGKIYLSLYNQNWASIGLFPRLLSNGDIDHTFRWSKTSNHYPNSVETSDLTDVIVEKDGNLIISGYITNRSGVWKENIDGIYRMNPDGDLINMFDRRRSYGRELYQQNDGKIIALSINGNQQDPANLIRFFPDGRRDYSFNHFIALYSSSLPLFAGILVQEDGKVIIYGDFSAVNGVSKNGIVRLSGEN